MNLLSCRGVAKRYGPRTVLTGVDLDLDRGDTCALLGESGAGKTTLARIICGLERVDAGACRLARGAAPMLVPQDFVIWPHLTVQRNVQLGCRRSTGGAVQLAREWISWLGIAALADRRADQLSFGQQQRVALARAFCFEPDLLVLDEPLAHVDAPGRRTLVDDLKRVFRKSGLTVLWVTHDPREAFSVGAKVAVLDQGRIGQFTDPLTVYSRPATVRIGQLTGDLNVLSAAEWTALRPLLGLNGLTDVTSGKAICLRPEALMCELCTQSPWTLSSTTFAGSGWVATICADNKPSLRVWLREAVAPGARVRLWLDGEPSILDA